MRARFFVIRGVPFRFGEEDLTDIDLWLYERPTGTNRRVQICDIKYKQRPKAVERIFWTRGVADALDVDGAYVATTDKRKSLRTVAKKLDIHLIDGTDLQRMQTSHSIYFPERLSDEELIAILRDVDKSFRNRELQDARVEILSSLSDGFGASSVVRSLEAFGRLASQAVTYHPNSAGARAAGRLAYLAAAIVCESLDYVSVDAAFRTMDERRDLLLNAVRYGALGGAEASNMLRLAMRLVEKYDPAGKRAAVAIESGLKRDLEAIPAEIIADQAVKLLRGDLLFEVGRELELACYHKDLPTFDQINTHPKSMLGALLDYASVDRERFARAWQFDGIADSGKRKPDASNKDTAPRTLFDQN